MTGFASSAVVTALAWIVLALPAVSHGQEDDDIQIERITVRSPDWDGFITADWSGIYGETFKAIFEPIGIELELSLTPYEASIAKVQDGESDVAMSVFMNEFPGVLYPRWPQERERTLAVHRKDTPYQSISDLVGKELAWVKGYGFEKFLPDTVEYSEVRTEVLGLRMVDRGNIDFFIDYPPTINSAAEEGGVDLEGLTLTPIKELSRPVYPIFRRDARGQAIMAIYDRRMQELYEDGTLDRLFRKHGYDGYIPPDS